MISELVVLLLFRAVHAQFTPDQYGQCGDCFCINGDDQCPAAVPETNFTSLIPTLKSLQHSNPMVLPCNFYTDTSCDTIPALEDGGACIVELDNASACPSARYSLYTFSGSLKQAQRMGLHVTHEGPCGVCSSLQDLAAYMASGPFLRLQAGQCGLLGISDPQAALQCFVDLGFTLPCAQAWLYNTFNTGVACRDICLQFVQNNDPPFGPPPTCELAECLECDEINSVPLWIKFAGRGRRNSGLLSGIVRPCEELVDVQQADPCVTATCRPNKATCNESSECCNLCAGKQSRKKTCKRCAKNGDNCQTSSDCCKADMMVVCDGMMRCKRESGGMMGMMMMV